MRIVLDTNVVVSALLWRGTPYRLLQAIRRQEHTQLFSSAVLLTELGEVLVRPALARRLVLVGRSARDILADYIDAVELVSPVSVPIVVAADRDDDQVVAAAITAEAEFIVSGDHHLLDLGTFRKIPILTPADAIQRIGA